MIDPAAIRPKLKQNAVVLYTDEGVLFQSDGATFRLKGASVAGWMSQLSPYLTGEYTLDTLCERLAPTPAETIIRLVDTLLHKGVLKNALPEAPELLPEAIVRHFRSQIAFIDHFSDRPQQRFKTFRESRLLLIGSGEALTSLALSLMRNGLEQLFLAPTDGAGAYAQALAPEVDRLRERGCEVLLSTVETTPEGTPASLGDYDLLVFCSDHASLHEVATLNQRCVKEGCPFLPAVVVAGWSMLGPYVQPPSGPCWLCALMRLSANVNDQQSAALWRALALGTELGGGRVPVFAPVARRIGTGLSFELFKILSGTLPSETEGGVIFQDLDTLESSRGTLLPHPLCPACSRFDFEVGTRRLEDLVTGRRDRPLSHEDLLRHSSSLIDPHLGAFSRFADGDILQLPLKGTRLLAGSPISPLAGRIDVTTYHLENVLEARHRALLEAVNTYSQRLLDARGMVFASMDELAADGKRVIAVEALSTWSGAAPLERKERTHWLPGFSLFTQCPRYVPAAAIYPHSPLNSLGRFERTSAGSATGSTFRELLAAGMCSASGYDILRQLIRGQCAVIELDLDALASVGTDLTFLLKSARRFVRPFAILEVVHDAPLSVTLAHTLDASPGESIVAIGIGLSGLEAASKAMLDLVGKLQHLEAQGTLPASQTELFPGFSPHADLVRANPAVSRFSQSATTIQQLEAFLQDRGREVLFVNTTPLDIWATETLLSGIVLLAQAAYGEEDPVCGSEVRP